MRALVALALLSAVACRPASAADDQGSSAWRATQQLVADMLHASSSTGCPPGSSPCPTHKNLCCADASGVEVPQQTLPPGCFLHTAGCFDDCSSGQACKKDTVRTLPIGVAGCCQAGQDLNGQCPGVCGAKMCVNAATKDFKDQCPTATDEKECPPCESAKLSLEYCANICIALGDYKYSGVEWGTQCFCGQELSAISKQVDEAKCSLGCNPNGPHPDCACPGKPTEKCGGGMTMMVTEIVCEGNFGWTVVFLLAVVGSGYLVGGVAWAKHTGASGVKPSAAGPRAMLQSHPHYGRWQQLHGLCTDGVRYAKGGARGGYKPLTATAAAPPTRAGAGRDEEGDGGREGAGQKRSSKRSSGGKEKRSKGEGKSSSKESKSKSPKEGKSRKASGSAAVAEESVEVEADGPQEGETVAEAKARELREQRDEGVHSSQQRIKVVGLNG